MNLVNKTTRPIRVPLPDGKKLFLGPRKAAQINARSAKHPALLALVESGDLELDDTDHRVDPGGAGAGSSKAGNQGSGAPSNIRRTGDR